MEKTRKSEEIKRLKNLKKAEIASKLTMIEKYSGATSSNIYIVIPADTFEKDFDPAEYDQLMDSMFDASYYTGQDPNPALEPSEKVQENDVDVDRIEKTEDLPLVFKEGAPNSWWRCDGCFQGILENQWRFDCTECPNYTLCSTCRTTVVHNHRLKRFKVPLGCTPPSNITKIECDSCHKDVTSEIRYDCTKCEDFTLCENCNESTEHPHQLKSVQDLWQELEALDYEDLVAGVKCKFKYRDVKPQDYGLTDMEILEWDDQKLNKLVSLKKLAPYREDGGSMNITKRKKKFIEKSKEKQGKREKSTREDSYKT